MKYYAIVPILFFLSSAAIGEERVEIFRIGINGAGGVMSITDLNNLADTWLTAHDDSLSSSTVQISHEGDKIDFNIEYGVQPFFCFTLWNIWQIGGKFDYLLSPHLYNSLLRDTIKIDLQTYIPSIYTALRLGAFEIGGCAINAISTVNWNDNFFGYKSKWSASDWGYEVKLGLAPRMGKYAGFNFSVGYRSLVLKNVFDNSGRRIYFSNSGKPFTLDLSGVVVNLGLYFACTYRKGEAK
jgi:hypothetical protein